VANCVILATQEAEIRRIMVPSHTGKILCNTLSQKNPSQKKKNPSNTIYTYISMVISWWHMSGNPRNLKTEAGGS
jgi:hypothetical protein